MSEVWHGSHWAEVNVSSEWHFFLEALGGRISLTHGPFLHPQSQQQWVEYFTNCITLTSYSASLSRIQGHLWLHWAYPDNPIDFPISCQLISSLNSTFPGGVTHTQIPGISTWTSLGDYYSACHCRSKGTEMCEDLFSLGTEKCSEVSLELLTGKEPDFKGSYILSTAFIYSFIHCGFEAGGDLVSLLVFWIITPATRWQNTRSRLLWSSSHRR